MPYYRLFYHCVWATKDRLPLIEEANRDTIFRVIVAKVDELRGIVHAINAMPDHLHLVATVRPSVAVSDFIGQVKGASSHAVNEAAPHDPHRLWFAWQVEYGVVSVTESHLPVVVRYVENQQEHHARGTLRPRLERMTGENS